MKHIYLIPGLCWCAGLYLGSQWNLPGLFAFGTLLGFSLSFTRMSRSLGYLSFLWTLLCIGALLSSNDHTARQQRASGLNGAERPYTAIIRSCISQRAKSQRLQVELLPGSYVFQKEIGVYLYFSVSDSLGKCTVGDSIQFKSALHSPESFDDFDYKSFLKGEGIYYTGFVRRDDWILKPQRCSDWRRVIYDYRWRCEQALMNWDLSDQEEKLIKALLLGIRDGLPTNIKAQFAEIGVIHVLAVSGLHLGIWYMGWVFVFRLIPRRFRQLRTVLLIPVIWIFALITGASPSVVRAATMFSIIAIQNSIGKGRNNLDTVMLSLILITAIDPGISSKIGFQLSYLAVVGILCIYPWLDRSWNTSIKVLKALKSLSAVSISAQIATTPLSFYYFRRFPLLFLPANLLVVPLVTLTVYIGFAALVCQLMGIFPYPMVLVISYFLKAILWITSELSV